MEKQIYTSKQLAQILPIGEHKLRKLANTYPNFPALRNGNRLLFFREDVEEWLREQAKHGVKI